MLLGRGGNRRSSHEQEMHNGIRSSLGRASSGDMCQGIVDVFNCGL